MTSELNGNFEGQYLRQRTKYRQLGNSVGNYEGSPTSSQNFMNFGQLMAKNRTIVFTHPQHLLGGGGHALQRATIASCHCHIIVTVSVTC